MEKIDEKRQCSEKKEENMQSRIRREKKKDNTRAREDHDRRIRSKGRKETR